MKEKLGRLTDKTISLNGVDKVKTSYSYKLRVGESTTSKVVEKITNNGEEI